MNFSVVFHFRTFSFVYSCYQRKETSLITRTVCWFTRLFTQCNNSLYNSLNGSSRITADLYRYDNGDLKDVKIFRIIPISLFLCLNRGTRQSKVSSRLSKTKKCCENHSFVLAWSDNCGTPICQQKEIFYKNREINFRSLTMVDLTQPSTIF